MGGKVGSVQWAVGSEGNGSMFCIQSFTTEGTEKE